MRFTRNTALGLIPLVAALALQGCSLPIGPKKKGTLSCSCAGTGCECSHCSGEATGCSCTATDAYPSNRVGEAGD